MEVSRSETPLYFTASPLKLVVLSVLTFGYYEFYWFYRNWVAYKKRTGRLIFPGWRAMFAPLWAYKMFADIHEKAREYRQPFVTSAAMLTLAYLLLFAAHFLSQPAGWLAALTVVPLLLANNLASWINEAAVPGYRENARFTALNILAVLCGLMTLALKIAFMVYDAPTLADAGLADLGLNPELIKMLNN